MDSTNPASEVNSVLTTYELIENIFSHLDFLDLIHAQQVCRQWRDVTRRSQQLRYQLFVEPQGLDGEPPRREWVHSTHIVRRKRNRILDPVPIFRFYARDSFERYPCEVIIRYQEVLHMLSWHSGLWEDMLISIPPPRKVVIRIGGARWSGDYDTIVNDAGVRLGQFRRSMSELLRARNGLDWKGDLMRKVEQVGLRVILYEHSVVR